MPHAPSSRLDRLLAGRRMLLADGAMATCLFDDGLKLGEAAELWCVERPERVLGLHRAFVAAGADLILTNSFGANRVRLARAGASERVAELAEAAARLARAAADDAGRDVAVAGSVGPTGARVAADGDLGEDEAVAVFREPIAALKAGGVDLVWIETMSDVAEMRAAARAAVAEGLPYVLTASFHAQGRTGAGLTPEAFAAFVETLDVPPLAFGANCGSGPDDTVRTVAAMTCARPAAMTVAKANCGLPVARDGRFVYPETPERMAAYACEAVASGARFVGGCCGTTPSHLVAMRRAVDGLPG